MEHNRHTHRHSNTHSHTHRHTPHTRYNVDSKKFCIIYERSANGGNTRRTQAPHTKTATHTHTHTKAATYTESVTYTCRDTHTSTGAHTVRDDARTTDLNAIALKYVVSCSLSTGYGCWCEYTCLRLSLSPVSPLPVHVDAAHVRHRQIVAYKKCIAWERSPARPELNRSCSRIESTAISFHLPRCWDVCATWTGQGTAAGPGQGSPGPAAVHKCRTCLLLEQQPANLVSFVHF